MNYIPVPDSLLFFILETRQLNFIEGKHAAQGHTLFQKRVIYLYDLDYKYKTQNQVKIILKDKNHSNLFFTSKRKSVGVLFKIDRKEKRTLTATKKEKDL